MEDERFNLITSNAKFRRIPKKEQKVRIDNRFQSMFKDKKFKEEYTVDERGRPVSYSTTKNLKRFYHLTSSEESCSESEEEIESKTDEISNKELKAIDVDEKITVDVKKKLKNLKVDYARGEQQLFSESSSDEESEDELEVEEVIDHKWGELDAEADTTEEVSYRLAACNMDWDRIRAVDIMVLLTSFLSSGETIESVKIYLSEFGKRRLAEEDISGPLELRNNEVDEETEGSKFHMEKLRQYQLNRLKYYYAVVTFSDADTANKVYTDCDGMEYESSATKIDLRFIPDDMIFDEEPKEICDKMPDMNKYQPRFFITTALQQAKVELTWDETNPDRIEMTKKINSGKLEHIDKVDLQNYLALTDEESDEEGINSDKEGDENPLEKYKALLSEIEEKEIESQNKDVQMEISWGLRNEKKSQEFVKKKLAEKEEKTPFQQYLDKKKEKRKEKKKHKKQTNESNSDSDIPSDIDMNNPYFTEEFSSSEFALKKKNKKRPKEIEDVDGQDELKQAELELLMNDDTDNINHFSLKKIQENNDTSRKRKKNNKKNKEVKDSKEDNFEVDIADARFSAIFSSHHFNIDPSDSHYKKTQGMEKLISEKLKRRANGEIEVLAKKNKIENISKKNVELSALVKSVKTKAEAMNKNK